MTNERSPIVEEDNGYGTIYAYHYTGREFVPRAHFCWAEDAFRWADEFSERCGSVAMIRPTDGAFLWFRGDE